MNQTTDQDNTTKTGDFPWGQVANSSMSMLRAMMSKSKPTMPTGGAYRMGEDVPQYDEAAGVQMAEAASNAEMDRRGDIGGGVGTGIGTGLGFIFGGAAGAQVGGAIGDTLGRGVSALFGDGGAKAKMMQQMSDERRYSREAGQRNAMQQQQNSLDDYKRENEQRMKAKVQPYTLSNFMNF